MGTGKFITLHHLRQILVLSFICQLCMVIFFSYRHKKKRKENVFDLDRFSHCHMTINQPIMSAPYT